MAKRTVSASLDETLLRALERRRVAEQISRSEAVRRALRAWVAGLRRYETKGGA